MAHAPTDALERRHDRVRQLMIQQSLDALIVTSLPNITYLTNFSGSSAIAVLTRDRVLFLTDSRYATTMSDLAGSPCACPGLVLEMVEGSYDAKLARVLTKLPGQQAGFEASHLSVARHEWLVATLGKAETAPRLVGADGIVESARVVKDAVELDVLREAGRRLSTVTAAVFAEVRRGRTERDVALAIDTLIRQAGFERTAFDTIVAAGPNAALPHARPTERKFVEGDLVVLDFGGVYDSYCVDLTRTVAVGKASNRAREVYGAVLEAHDRAIASVKPGQSRFAIDAAARDTLGRYGLAEAFGHGTGHGLGIEVHEDPK